MLKRDRPGSPGVKGGIPRKSLWEFKNGMGSDPKLIPGPLKVTIFQSAVLSIVFGIIGAAHMRRETEAPPTPYPRQGPPGALTWGLGSLVLTYTIFKCLDQTCDQTAWDFFGARRLKASNPPLTAAPKRNREPGSQPESTSGSLHLGARTLHRVSLNHATCWHDAH